MNTLDYILTKFKPNISESPIKLHGINRTIMAQVLGELGFKEGIEIGVAEGKHAEVLLDNIPDLRLHLVDIWSKYPGYEEYLDLESLYQEAMKRLAGRNIFVQRRMSADAASYYADESLDFVYIDAGHDFKNIAIDIYEWSKKVKRGGIVFGHDYKHRAYQRGSRYAVHVKPVVDAYMQAFDIRPYFVLTNDVRDKTFGPDNPGWMYIK